MRREVTQRELRNDSGSIMRALDEGDSFIITRNGVPVGELRPVGRPQFMRSADLMRTAVLLPPIDAKQFRKDLDAFVDQDPAPRV